MTDPQKTVFISYRRKVSFGMSRAIFMDLRANGYDAFMDVESIDSGTFDTVILNQIAARAHFLIILEPGTLERCLEPGDWLRREIEYAMDLGRNIVPVMVERFVFDDQTRQYLTGRLSELPRYNGLPLYHDYFDDGMRRLRDRFLKQPIYGPIMPAPRNEEAVVQQKIEEVEEQSKLDNMLNAQEYYNRAVAKWDAGDYEGVVADCTQAIRLNPEFAEAYSRRSGAHVNLGHLEETIVDCNKALYFNGEDSRAYNNRGVAHDRQGDVERAMADYNEALRLNPQYAVAYNNRGVTYENKGDYQRALADYEASLRIEPKNGVVRNNRDNLLNRMGRK